jgi:hypothetical protein
MIYQPVPDMKECRECGRNLPFCRLVKNKRLPDGVDACCKECRNAYDRQRYDHKPDRKEYLRQYNQTPKAKAKKSLYHKTDAYKLVRAKYQAKPEVKERRRQNGQSAARKAHNRSYRNRPEVKARNRAYMKSYTRTPVYRLTDTAKRHRRESAKVDLPYLWSPDEWQRCLAYWDNRCAVCGRPAGPGHTLAADHWIPLKPNYVLSEPNPGTVPWNITPLCHGENGCNNSKYNSKPEEWLVRRFDIVEATQILNKIQAHFRRIKTRTLDEEAL